MTFRQLTYIVEISKCGSINKAARKLFLSQSGISTAVRELEDELGIRFFERNSRGVEFTPEGREFLSYAVSLLEQKKRIEGLYGGQDAETSPAHFSVSTQRYPFTEDAFLSMVKRAEENRYRFAIKETGMDAVIDDVYDHRSDIGVIFLTDNTESLIRRLLDARELEFHELAAVPPCIYVRKGHPLACMERVSESMLAGFPYVSFEHDQGVAVDFSEEYQILSFKRPAKSISVNNRTTAINVLACTDAYTTGSGLLVRGITDSRVLSVPIGGNADIHLGWIRPRNSKPSPKVDEFVSLLRQSVENSISYTERVHRKFSSSSAD